MAAMASKRMNRCQGQSRLPQEKVTAVRPSAQTFYTLAVFAYAAGDKRTGDLAAAKTLSLTPAARKTQTKLLLEQAKKPQSAQGGAQAPVQSATGQ